MRKITLVTFTISILVIVFLILSFGKENYSKVSLEDVSLSQVANIDLNYNGVKRSIENEDGVSNVEITIGESVKMVSNLESISDNNFTLKLYEELFELTIGKTLYDSMLELSSLGRINLAGREFPSIGFFVESINGVKNENGAYWTLYINKKEATVGVSSYKPQKGDLIEWKYEKR